MSTRVLSEWIQDATRQYILERQNTHPEIADFVKKVDALPLYVDMGGGVAIRSDGELIGFIWDEPESIQIETDQGFRFLALVVGSQKYPELACLRPVRTADDRDCPLCEGTGRLRELEQAGMDTTQIRCYCGGAGWLPANVPDAPRG